MPQAIVSLCLAYLATATGSTSRQAPPTLILQQSIKRMQENPWMTIAATTKMATASADDLSSTKVLPKDDVTLFSMTPTPAPAEDLPSTVRSPTDLSSKVRPRYRHYAPLILTHKATLQPSAVSEVNSYLAVKPASNATPTPASSTTTTPEAVWYATSSMPSHAGEWYGGPWDSLAAPLIASDVPVPDVPAMPRLEKFTVVVDEEWCRTLIGLLHVFAKIVLWGVLLSAASLAHPSNDKLASVVVEEEAMTEEDDFENAIGGPDVELMQRETSPKKGFVAFIRYISGKKSEMVRRNSIVTEGDASEILELWEQVKARPRRLSASAMLMSLQYIRRGSTMEGARIRSESNEPRMAQSASVNIDMPAAANAAASAALASKEGKDASWHTQPTNTVGVNDLSDKVNAADAVKTAAEAEVEEEVQQCTAHAEGFYPSTKWTVRARASKAYTSIKHMFKGSTPRVALEPPFVFGDQEIIDNRTNNNNNTTASDEPAPMTRTPTIATTDVRAFRFNPHALANRRAALRAAATPAVVPTPTPDTNIPAADAHLVAAAAAAAVSAAAAAAAAAVPPRVLQITCDYDDDEHAVASAGAGDLSPIPGPTVLTRPLSWLNVSQSGSGGIFSCEDLELTVVPPAVLPVEDEKEIVSAAPAVVINTAAAAAAPVAAAAPSHPRDGSGGAVDVRAMTVSLGRGCALFGINKTGVGLVVEEGEEQEGDEDAEEEDMGKEEEEEEEEEEEMSTFF